MVEGGSPDTATQQQAEQHGSTAHILGSLGQVMPFRADTVDRGLDAGVQQLNDHHQQHRTGQQRGLHPTATDPEGQGQQDAGGEDFLSEGRLMPAGTQAFDGVTQGVQDAVETDAAFLGG